MTEMTGRACGMSGVTKEGIYVTESLRERCRLVLAFDESRNRRNLLWRLE